MPCDCRRCRSLPFPPTAAERWLCEAEDEWPWRVFGIVLVALGLLLIAESGLAAGLVLVGVLIAAVPLARQRLLGCARATAR